MALPPRDRPEPRLMGQLILVRHAQAMFAAPDYDQLSVLGREQARVLGAALARRLPQVDAVFTGTQLRHRETAEICLAARQQALAPTALAGFDEFDHRDLAARFLAAGDGAASGPDAGADSILAGAVRRWISGACDADYDEPWPAFRTRCIAALDDLARTAPRSTTTLVFTSGGPIAAICQRLLQISDAHVPRLIASLVNCGLSKVVIGASGPRLSTLNDHAHFEGGDQRLITYR
jgi:broad specificity phosphatase PhoE